MGASTAARLQSHWGRISMIEIEYEPALIEEIVRQEMQRRENVSDTSLFERYQDLTEPLYALSEEARDPAFVTLHKKLFADLGFQKLVQNTLGELPRLAQQGVTGVLFQRAESRAEEGADLVDNLSARKKWIVVKLRPQAFSERSMKNFLRHELMHIADMLDPQFEYDRSTEAKQMNGAPACSFVDRSRLPPTKERLIRQRYGLLWCITIDGRLARSGKEPVMDREERLRQFETVFSMGKEFFEALWKSERPSHRELWQMARTPTKISKWAGQSALYSVESVTAPGSPCPLCGFPTFCWVVSDELDPIAARIQHDFPTWEPGQSICARCWEFLQNRMVSAGRNV
jgi:hypothetical protein